MGASHNNYKDVVDARPRVEFETKQTLPGNLSTTDEGFLICKDVALARTGQQIYLGYEVPLEPGPDGTVVVERLEEEVFAPDTIESFRGKPFTNDHPVVDVDPRNWRHYMVGTIMNPRRGTGDRSHCLLGDIIVYDTAVIEAIRAGKREVSCGYSADYERLEPGRGAQRAIRGNHVSLVAEGRCGPTCAIMDGKEPIMATDKKNWMDSLRSAFKAKDEDAFEEAINEAKKEGADESDEPERPATEEKEGGSNQHHVTVNIGGMTPDSVAAMKQSKAKDEDPEMEAADPMDKVKAVVLEALAPVMARLDSIESAVEDVSDPADMHTQDAIARAEILSPGVKLPTLDSKPGSKATRDAVLAFQRRTLAEAYATADGQAAIKPLVGGVRPNFNTMPAGEVAIVFRGASERMRDANNAKRGADLPIHITSDGQQRVFDNAAWNRKNKDFWKRA